MDSQETKELLDKLVEKSKEKKIEWKETADSETFVATIRGTTFRTEIHYDSWGNAASTGLAMVDPNGNEMWSITTYQADAEIAESIRLLYSLAKQIALRVDEKIAAVLKTLDDL